MQNFGPLGRRRSDTYLEAEPAGKVDKLGNQVVQPGNQVVQPDNQVVQPDNQLVGSDTIDRLAEVGSQHEPIDQPDQFHRH